ncbi:hypothetical protein [Peribacillus sp. SCS-155]|uniref:hypothetical protein n=1 Tax=Peribacillus sedimenti TaxID=3115297 RepID=UPI003905DB1A
MGWWHWITPVSNKIQLHLFFNNGHPETIYAAENQLSTPPDQTPIDDQEVLADLARSGETDRIQESRGACENAEANLLDAILAFIGQRTYLLQNNRYLKHHDSFSSERTDNFVRHRQTAPISRIK